jgi:hypothetical protein
LGLGDLVLVRPVNSIILVSDFFCFSASKRLSWGTLYLNHWKLETAGILLSSGRRAMRLRFVSLDLLPLRQSASCESPGNEPYRSRRRFARRAVVGGAPSLLSS